MLTFSLKRILFPLSVCLLAVGFALSADALSINGVTAAANNRWANSPVLPLGPFTPNTNAAFVGLGYDLSGVGWQSTSTSGYTDLGVTLLSPMHFAAATHVTFGYINTSYTFYTTNGNLVTRSIGGTLNAYDVDPGDVNSDARIVRLDTPFNASDNVTAYRLLDVGDVANLVGYPEIMSGHENSYVNPDYQRRIGLSKVLSSSSGNSTFASDPTISSNNYASTYVTGDSGSPTFAVYNGKLAFLGTHHYTPLQDESWTRTNDFVPLNAYMAKDGYALLWTIDTNYARLWTGNSISNFSTAANWKNSNLPSATYSAAFDGGATANRAINLSSAATMRGMLIKAASGINPFTFTGSALTLMESGIRNEDTDTMTINNPIILGGSQTWETANGAITIGGNVTNNYLLVISGSQALSFSGTISGSGSVSWDNSTTWNLPAGQLAITNKIFVRNGTVNLTSSNAYAGGTFVTGGTLLVNNTNGSATGTNTVTVSQTGALGGSGTINGLVTFQNGGRLAANLATPPASFAKLTITGALNLGSASTLAITAGAGATNGTYTLVTASGGVSGTLPSLALPTNWTATAQIVGTNLNLVVSSTPLSAPVITPGQSPGTTINYFFSYAILASGNPTNWNLVSGSLPAGVTLNTNTGVLSGAPTSLGTYPLTLTAANGNGPSPVETVTLMVSAVAPPLVYESFAYTAGSGLLANQNGGTGWSNAWDNGPSDINASGSAYTNGANTLLVAGGRAVIPNGIASYRYLSTNYSSGTYWLSFIAKSSNPGNSYAGLSLYGGSSENLFIGQRNNTNTWGLDQIGRAHV